MSNLSPATTVFPFFINPQAGTRVFLTKVESIRSERLNKLVLTPFMDDDFHVARSFRYDTAVAIRDRILEDWPPQYDLRFALSPTGEEVARASSSSAPTSDKRTVTFFNGYICRPYIPNGWCMQLYEGEGPARRQLESVRGDTIEECHTRAEERNVLKFCEKAGPATRRKVAENSRQPR